MPQDAATDALIDIKRQQEVANRPGQTADVPKPPALRAPKQHEFSSASYKMAAPKSAKPKSEMEKSLDYNAQQRKVAEDATK